MAARSVYTWLVFCDAMLLVAAGLSLDTAREFLTREEDTIVFSLIERAKHGRRSFVEIFVRDSEALQAKAGRYQSQEEIPFTLPPPHNFTMDLHPAAALVNANDDIWRIYFQELLPLMLAKNGDDGDYAVTAAADLACLQALSRRINYGRFVAEVKFRGDQQGYTALIRSKDKDAMMKLLTSEVQENVVKRRVEKKAMVFGQDVTLDEPTNSGDMNSSEARFKVDPSLVYKLYDQWVIPLTKQVEVDYLLRRLD